jgi:hypothetical protein
MPLCRATRLFRRFTSPLHEFQRISGTSNYQSPEEFLNLAQCAMVVGSPKRNMASSSAARPPKLWKKITYRYKANQQNPATDSRWWIILSS